MTMSSAGREALDEALSRLPHGPGFRFVDRVLTLEPGKRGTGEYKVLGSEPFLAGHFPGDPLFPGVLLIEACAQLAGVVAQSDPDHGALPRLKLAAVRGSKIMGSARPGEVITLHAEVSGRMGHLIQAKASASVLGALVLQCELTLAGAPSTRTEPRPG
ncbi:MAG: 3-hydroxyacyl-ACP dehydratase FabZ family protein [Limisphaerales bacterium]